MFSFKWLNIVFLCSVVAVAKAAVVPGDQDIMNCYKATQTALSEPSEIPFVYDAKSKRVMYFYENTYYSVVVPNFSKKDLKRKLRNFVYVSAIDRSFVVGPDGVTDLIKGDQSAQYYNGIGVGEGTYDFYCDRPSGFLGTNCPEAHRRPLSLRSCLEENLRKALPEKMLFVSSTSEMITQEEKKILGKDIYEPYIARADNSNEKQGLKGCETNYCTAMSKCQASLGVPAYHGIFNTHRRTHATEADRQEYTKYIDDIRSRWRQLVHSKPQPREVTGDRVRSLFVAKLNRKLREAAVQMHGNKSGLCFTGPVAGNKYTSSIRACKKVKFSPETEEGLKYLTFHWDRIVTNFCNQPNEFDQLKPEPSGVFNPTRHGM